MFIINNSFLLFDFFELSDSFSNEYSSFNFSGIGGDKQITFRVLNSLNEGSLLEYSLLKDIFLNFYLDKKLKILFLFTFININ